MFAIFKRELRSYFTSLVGYVVIGVMLAFIGLYLSLIHISEPTRP